MTKERSFKRELSMINRARLALGKKALDYFPQGIPNECGHCVVAKSLGIFIDRDDMTEFVSDWSPERETLRKLWRTSKSLARVPLPAILNKFAWEFDRGLIPSLIEPGWEGRRAS